MDSSLPSGEQLSKHALDLVRASAEILLTDLEIASLYEAVGDLRLEIMLERLATEISKARLFSVFHVLRGASPNFNHFAAVAVRPRAIVTTNQDILSEEAAKILKVPCSIVHLHGRCDNVQSIRTMISQYLVGLPRLEASAFRRALTGADVTVLGYSGRDGDVMSVFGEGLMKSMTWVCHPGTEKSPELVRLQDQLGPRLIVIELDAREWFKKRLPKKFRLTAEKAGRQQSQHRQILTSNRSASRRLSLIEGNLALGRLIEHLGWYDLALNLYSRVLKRIRRTKDFSAMSFKAQHAIARVNTYRYRFDLAARQYSRIARDAKLPLEARCQALIDRVFALRNYSQVRKAKLTLSELEDLLSTAPKRRIFQKLRGDALAARAGMLRIEGNALESMKLCVQADVYYRSARDVDGWLEISTWICDNLLMLGKFREATAQLKECMDQLEAYGRYFSKAWAIFLYGELCGFRGNLTEGIALIRESSQIFHQVNNPQGIVYCLLYLSDIVRENSIKESEVILKRAESIIKANNFAYAKARFLLESAELARARRKPRQMRSFLAALRKHLLNKSIFPIAPPIFFAHAKAIEAEHARETLSVNAAARLAEARAAYDKLGNLFGATRMMVSEFLNRPTHELRSNLITVCEREGYGYELRQLADHRTDSFYPLHFA